ncbi:reverse transcriptase, partial [Phytophthora megakarya]
MQLALVPASSHGDPSVGPPGDDSSNDGEPDPKRSRLDDYEVVLAAADVPLTYREVMNSPDAAKWKDAIRAELRSHIRNHTWDIVRRPFGTKVIGCKWVFALKRNEQGEITFGVDYHETYSPVAGLSTLRVFFAVCNHLGYFIKQFDVETAFLNGDLDEDDHPDHLSLWQFHRECELAMA